MVLPPPTEIILLRAATGIRHLIVEALLNLLSRRWEGQPHTYLYVDLPLGLHFSWYHAAEPYELTNRNHNAAYSQQIQSTLMFLTRVTASSVMCVGVCIVSLVKKLPTFPFSVLCRPSTEVFRSGVDNSDWTEA